MTSTEQTAALLAAHSGVSYVTVDVSEDDYTPDTPFRAIHIGTGGAGDLTLTGHDGYSVTLKLAEGLHPLGGLAIVASTTTASELTAIF